MSYKLAKVLLAHCKILQEDRQDILQEVCQDIQENQ